MAQKRYTQYSTLEDFLQSTVWQKQADILPHEQRRLFNATRLENMIYQNLRQNVDIGMDVLEEMGVQKINTFPELLRDLFQTFYSTVLNENSEESLSAQTRMFNRQIMKQVQASEIYGSLKAICEGHELAAYAGVMEFADIMTNVLDGLMEQMQGEKPFIDLLKHLEEKREDLEQNIKAASLVSQTTAKLNKQILRQCNCMESLQEQINNLTEMIKQTQRRNNDSISAFIASALESAAEKAQQVKAALSSWGEYGSGEKAYQMNREILEQCRKSPEISQVMKYFGRFRELMENRRKNSYAFGRGDMYDIELGRDYSRAISSEYVNLAIPETVPLFVHKVMTKQLKQYRRREKSSEGHGDCIILIDESGSMSGDLIAWAKALALTLMENALRNKRKCALIRFSSASQVETHCFYPGKISFDDVQRYIESFYCGGTNFVAPLKEMLFLAETQDFNNADAIFLSDGNCAVPENILKEIEMNMKMLNFRMTTVLLGEDNNASSLAPISENVFLGRDVNRDTLAMELIKSAA